MRSRAEGEPRWIQALALALTLAAIAWYGQHQLSRSLQFLYQVAVLIYPGLSSLLG